MRRFRILFSENKLRRAPEIGKNGVWTSFCSPENARIHGFPLRCFDGQSGSCSRDGPAVVDGVTSIPISGYTADCAAGPGKRHGPRLRHFLAGPENRLVEVAVRSAFDGTEVGDNPLVLYGPSGTGKSHLAWGLAAAWKSQRRSPGVACLTAVDFARQMAEAIEAQAMADFREEFDHLGLLVVEDIGLLAGKEAAQRELAHLLDRLITESVRVVVTAAAAPEQLPGILPRLQSRLAAGLTVPLALPSAETRLEALRQWAALRGLVLSDAVAQSLAAGLQTSVPELFGALVQLEAAGETIDLEAVCNYLECSRVGRRLELPEIASATARHFSLRAKDLRSASRRRAVVRARGVAMYLARELTGTSLHQIGVFFGGRDHTTVLHGCRRTAELLETEPSIRQAVQQVRQQIGVA